MDLIPTPVKLIFISLLIAGAAYWGYTKGSVESELKLANYRADAEKQISDLKTENIRISNDKQIQFVDRVKTINNKETIYRDGVAGLGPGQAQLSTGWVELHDAAAKLADPDSQLASDLTPSGVMDNSALAVVLTNYARCHENKQQLIALQQWIQENKEAVDRANAEKGSK